MLKKVWGFLIEWHRQLHIARVASSYSYRGQYKEATQYIQKTVNGECTAK